MQFPATVAGGLVLATPALALALCRLLARLFRLAPGLGLSQRLLARLLGGLLPRLCLRLLAGLLLGALLFLRLAGSLAGHAGLLDACLLLGLDARPLGGLRILALLLLGQQVGALDVGAFLAHLDGNGLALGALATRGRPACRAAGSRHGGLQLAVHLAPQRDLLRCAAGGRCCAALAVAFAQEVEQLAFLALADGCIDIIDFHTGLDQLGKQPVGRNADHLGELLYRYICHACATP
jgi:hypothetical protein